MCGEPQPKGKFDLYAVEGGTAAMCYIFKSLKAKRLLNAGDTIALGAPIFTPYLEMPHLKDYDLKQIHVRAPQENRFQCTDEELKKLEDPKVKALFVVNPGNPTAMALTSETVAKIVAIVKTKRPDLIMLTDDVYGTFVPGFESALGEPSAKHDRRLFVFEVFRLHRLAPRRNRRHAGQHPRRDDRASSPRRAGLLDQALRRTDAGAEQNQVHRPDRRGQPRRGAEPHGGPFLAATGHDDALCSVELMDTRRLPEGVHGHCATARRGDDRGHGRRPPPDPLFDYYYGLVDFEFGLASMSARTSWTT